MAEETRDHDATLLLRRASDGDANAADELFPLVYTELRARAGAQFRSQPKNHTLQPTALVHEAYVKMIRSSGGDWNDRAHFFAIASTVMRQILVDHERRRRARRRAADGHAEEQALLQEAESGDAVDLLALENALTKLASLDPQRARIVELRFFGGLGIDDVAQTLGVSRSTIVRQWKQSRAWLSTELAAPPPAGENDPAHPPRDPSP